MRRSSKVVSPEGETPRTSILTLKNAKSRHSSHGLFVPLKAAWREV